MTTKQNLQLQSIFTTAHKDYEKGLNSYALFKTHDSAIGQNLVQETFMKTWIYLVKRGQIDMMKTFLYHVLNNLIVDHYRKHKTSSLDTLIEKGFDPKADDHGRLFDFIDGKAAALLITELPFTYQKVVRMRYVQNLSLKEMALITGQSKNTVAVQAHRGLEKLKLLYSHV